MSDVNVVWHDHAVSRADHEALNGHKGCVVWFTGLSGSGKSTIANLVDRQLHQRLVHTYVLDGDNVRHGLNASPNILAAVHGEDFARRFGLGFGAQDREENIRRIGAVAQLFASAGLVTLTAFVSPYRRDRDLVRQHVCGAGNAQDFVEVYVDTPLELCEQRDPKGLYKLARSGQLKGFTGIDDPYEPPGSPELTLRTADEPPQVLATRVVEFLQMRGTIA